MAEYECDFKSGATSSEIEAVVAAIAKQKDEGVSGYFNLPYDQNIVDEVQNYYQQNSFLQDASKIAVVGIGGSSLGTKAIKALLEHKNKNLKELIFFENSDPIDIAKKIDKLDKKDTVIALISKSGTTIETISIFKTIIDALAIDLTQDSQNIIAITDKDSPLDKFATKYEIKSFEIAHNVGGRFSVLSAVGIVPLFLAGYDVQALLDGAKEQMDGFFDNKCDELVDKAYYFVKNKEKHPINVVFAYGSVLKSFVKWYIQLWGESLGKIDIDAKSVGFTPVGLIGSVDQHSFLQLIVEGPKDKTVTFITIKNFENSLVIPNTKLDFLQKTDFINGYSFEKLINAQAKATMQSLQEQGIPVDWITLESLCETEVGKLISYYEILTSVTGHLLQINSYDQPGVEMGKTILKGMFDGR